MMKRPSIEADMGLHAHHRLCSADTKEHLIVPIWVAKSVLRKGVKPVKPFRANRVVLRQGPQDLVMLPRFKQPIKISARKYQNRLLCPQKDSSNLFIPIPYVALFGKKKLISSGTYFPVVRTRDREWG
jgi:hypothetical protein